MQKRFCWQLARVPGAQLSKDIPSSAQVGELRAELVSSGELVEELQEGMAAAEAEHSLQVSLVGRCLLRGPLCYSLLIFFAGSFAVPLPESHTI